MSEHLLGRITAPPETLEALGLPVPGKEDEGLRNAVVNAIKEAMDGGAFEAVNDLLLQRDENVGVLLATLFLTAAAQTANPKFGDSPQAVRNSLHELLDVCIAATRAFIETENLHFKSDTDSP